MSVAAPLASDLRRSDPAHFASLTVLRERRFGNDVFRFVCRWLSFEIFTGRSRKSHGSMKASDRESFFLLVASVWTGIALDVLFCFRLPHAAIQRHREGIFLIGIVFMWTGIAFRYYAMRALGRYFTFDVATVLGQNVIEAGPYRYIRHPSYTGGIITVLGLGFALGN